MGIEATRNIMGCCVVSGKPVHEIHARYPDDHHFAGDPQKIGMPLPECMDVTLMLLNGSLMRVVCHKDYLTDLAPNLSQVWRNIMEAFSREDEVARAAVIVNQMSKKQQATKYQNMVQQVENRPLGIYCIERTLDRAERENAARSH